MVVGKNVEKLLDVLECPKCHDDKSLKTREEKLSFEMEINLSSSHIFCSNCQSEYPITDDGIPIMWSENLKSAFFDINSEEEKTGGSNLSANMKIYDSISDNYSMYTRKNSITPKRLKNSVRKIFGDRDTKNMFHVDFACGPGHVLDWLSPLKFNQIGIDVSLENLRNARKNTGCLVVCGDACLMPFKKDSIDLVTESSGLHHILDWKGVLRECGRICKKDGGIIIDCEPSQKLMAWSPLAIAVFNLRFPVYKFLSYFVKGLYIFRDTKEAKLNLEAEIHHQPGTGFPLDELEETFLSKGFKTDIIVSPTVELKSKARPSKKIILLMLLSGKNPWNPEYGSFIAIASNAKN